MYEIKYLFQVIIADPSQNNARDIFKLAESFYVHKAPIR